MGVNVSQRFREKAKNSWYILQIHASMWTQTRAESRLNRFFRRAWDCSRRSFAIWEPTTCGASCSKWFCGGKKEETCNWRKPILRPRRRHFIEWRVAHPNKPAKMNMAFRPIFFLSSNSGSEAQRRKQHTSAKIKIISYTVSDRYE